MALQLLSLRSSNNCAEDQTPMIYSQREAIATTREVKLDHNFGKTRKDARHRVSAHLSPYQPWIQVGDRWWFVGDDSEFKAISSDDTPVPFQRSFVPIALRRFDVLRLDTERLLWNFCAEQTANDDKLVNCQIPYHICGLPVVVMLPRSPCRILQRSVLDKIRIDSTCALKVEDLRLLYNEFPFATGMCIWMSGHIQLLAPHLSNAEVAALVIPSHAAGLQVSISRWSPAPTAAQSGPSSQQSQSHASSTKAENSNPCLNRQNADSAIHLKTVRLSDGTATNGMNGNCPHHNSAPIVDSSGFPTPKTSFPSSYQIASDLTSTPLRQAGSGSVPPHASTYVPMSDTNIAAVNQSVQVAESSSSNINNAVLTPQTGSNPSTNSRLKIGNTLSTAGVKVKVKGGPFAGRTFLSASTHAVFEGKTGKRLQTRSTSSGKKKSKNLLVRLFSTGRISTKIALGEVEVRDLHGNMIGKTVGSMIYDSHPIPSDALFPDALSHDLCFVGPLPEPTIRLSQRTPKLSWYLGNQLPLGCGVALLDDPDNSEGRSFRSGVCIQKCIKVRSGKRTVLLEKDVVDSTILFRRQALPLEDNSMSGAAVVTKGDDHRWNKVVGFQSFQFVPPEAASQVEHLWNESFEEDIRRGKTLSCCILGARPVPEVLKTEMEIINDDEQSP